MARRHRTQLLLDPPQHKALTRIATTQNRSVSDLVRQLIDWGLERLEADRERKLAALDRATSLRRKLRDRYGVYPGDPIAEARAEREQQTEEVLGLRNTAS